MDIAWEVFTAFGITLRHWLDQVSNYLETEYYDNVFDQAEVRSLIGLTIGHIAQISRDMLTVNTLIDLITVGALESVIATFNVLVSSLKQFSQTIIAVKPKYTHIAQLVGNSLAPDSGMLDRIYSVLGFTYTNLDGEKFLECVTNLIEGLTECQQCASSCSFLTQDQLFVNSVRLDDHITLFNQVLTTCEHARLHCEIVNTSG